MNHLKTLGLAALAAMAITAITAGSASATTLEVGGVVRSGAVTIEASATAGVVWAKTDGTEANTCSVSNLKGTTSIFSGLEVTASLSELSFKTCKRETVTVDFKGALTIDHELLTTSGEVYSAATQVTLPTSFGFSVSCSTAAGTKVGTLDGVASSSAHATLTVNAVLSCGFLLPSATWKGTYKISTPTGLGVVA